MPDSNLHAVAMRMHARGESIEDAARAVCDEPEPAELDERTLREAAYTVSLALRAAGLSQVRAEERANNIAVALSDGVEPVEETIRTMLRPSVVDEQHIAAAARAWRRVTGRHEGR